MVLSLPDEVPYARRGNQNLARHYPSLPVAPRDQRLGDDALERVGELGPDLMLLVGREDVDDPVHSLRRVLGVEGAEDEVAGLRSGHAERDGLEVAHLADEYYVRVLPEDVLEGLDEALGILVYLALVDNALLVLVVLKLLTSKGMSPAASNEPSGCMRTSRRINLYMWWLSSGFKESRYPGVTSS